MSCFVVSNLDIDIIVTAYARLNPIGARLLNLSQVGRELLLENVKSFEACYRVHGRPKGHAMRVEMAKGLLQARAYRFVRRRAKPAAIAKLAQFYDYQACEHAAYETSTAKAIVDALVARYPESLPDYEGMPWGIGSAVDLMRAGCTGPRRQARPSPTLALEVATMANHSKYGAKYEDNFGFYDLEADPDEAAFLEHVKASSTLKKCRRCHEPVKLRPKRT